MKAYRLFSTAAFAAFLGQVVLYAGGMVFGWPWAWAASGASAAMAFLLVLLTLQAELTPPTPGANDNATGAGLVLTLAEDLAAKPLVKSRVWCLCSGSEEALHEGAKAFFARHRSEMREPRAVVFEMLGCGRPAWGTKEGFVIPLWSAPGLRRLAGEVAAEHPQWGARPGGLAGGVTEMSDAILAGVPAITIICLDERGRAPYWHLPTDTVDKMDSLPGGAMDSAYRFVRAILERLDRSQG
ncbi:MAG: M28 family peptidase [Bacillota bacterium]|nr:MAG: M28 family peptidase [Bacillota bacterium]